MKTPSNELFLLIKSLDTQEKVYFKKNQNNKRYLLFFDIISQMEVYNEDKLKQEIANKEHIKNLKFVKSYVYEAILDSLTNYQLNNSPDAILSRQTHQIKILTKKCLYTSAKKLVVKAEKLAQNHGKLNHSLIISSLKRDIIISEMGILKTQSHRDQYEKELRLIEELKNEVDYTNLNVTVTNVILTQYKVSSEKLAELNKLLKSPLLLNEKSALTFTSKLIFYDTLGTIYYLLDNWTLCYNCYKKLFLRHQQNDSYMKENTVNYLKIANRLIVSSIRLNKLNEVNLLGKKIERYVNLLPSKDKNMNALKVYNQIQVNITDSYLQSLNIKEALRLSVELEKSITRYSNKQGYVLFYFNFTLIYFYLGNYKMALHQINKVLNNEETDLRSDTVLSSRIVSLIIHYELHNLDLLNSHTKSTTRYFSKKGALDGYSKALISFFSKNIILLGDHTIKEDRKKIKDAFVNLKKQLLSANHKEIPGNFEFMAWIDSKIENISILEVMKRG